MAADPRFFASAGPLTLAAIAAAAEGSHDGPADRLFSGVGPLQSAGPEQVSFLDNRRYLPALRETRAGAVVVAPDYADAVPAGAIAIRAAAPYLAFGRVARLFHPAPAPVPGVHPSAVVADDAVIGAGTEIGPHAVVGARGGLGGGCIVGAHAVIGPGVELGEGCRLHPHCTVSHAILGRLVVVHPGARIGQEGFGFAPTADGSYETMPQLGTVRIGDGAEVGANACIDRGSQGDTVIGPGTRIDNLVQIGHNVATGRGCVLVAQVGISGSTTLGDFVMAAGQAGLTGHLRIGDRTRIGAQSGVINDLPAGSEVMGTPSMPARRFWRLQAWLRRLGKAQGKTD